MGLLSAKGLSLQIGGRRKSLHVRCSPNSDAMSEPWQVVDEAEGRFVVLTYADGEVVREPVVKKTHAASASSADEGLCRQHGSYPKEAILTWILKAADGCNNQSESCKRLKFCVRLQPASRAVVDPGRRTKSSGATNRVFPVVRTGCCRRVRERRVMPAHANQHTSMASSLPST